MVEIQLDETIIGSNSVQKELCYVTGVPKRWTLKLRKESIKSIWDCIKTQLCTVAISLTLFNSTRLPLESSKHGAVPYLVVYSFWLIVVGLPTTLLQLSMGQLSQQDPVGVWRAVPILRGVGHLKIITSYLLCVYNMILAALALAYFIWIGKGAFPFRDCTRLQITPNGYVNKMNASECFNATFLASFTENPQYLGLMAVLIFILWFFVPIALFRLRKSLKVTLIILAPIVVIIALVLSSFLSRNEVLTNLFKSCEQWMPLTQPYIWHSAMVQALMSTHIVSGYLYSAGGTIYRQADVRWTSSSIITTNMMAGWLWVLFWQSIGDDGVKETSFIATLVLIYQSSVVEQRSKEWPLLQFGIVFVSGVITVLMLLFPIYDKLHRATGFRWRLFATAASAIGTILTVAILARGMEVASVLDELVIPVLAVFTTAVEVVGLVFIYGWCYLSLDIEFITGSRISCCWIAAWWCTPVLLIGVTGWWLRNLIRATWGQFMTLWPLVGVLLGILIIMIVMAAVAVAKEEQFNLISKMMSAFRSSRLWGPEEPMARYVWMSQRYANELQSDLQGSTYINYPQIIYNKNAEKLYNDLYNNDEYQRNYYVYSKNGYLSDSQTMYKDASVCSQHTVTRSKNIHRSKKKNKGEEKFRSPNICIAKAEIGGPIDCNCNRHFTLSVPDLSKSEVTTSL